MLLHAFLACGDWPLPYRHLATPKFLFTCETSQRYTVKVSLPDAGFSAIAILGGGELQSPACHDTSCVSPHIISCLWYVFNMFSSLGQIIILGRIRTGTGSMDILWRILVVLTPLLIGKACRVYNTILIHDNMSCPDHNNGTLFKEVPRHECVMQCTREACRLLSYNEEDKVCKLTAQPCEVLEDRSGFTSQTFRILPDSECLHWVTYQSGDVIPPRVIEISSPRVTSAIVRFPHEGDLLPGKLEYNSHQNVFSAYNRVGIGRAADSTVEFLTVHTMCTLIWLPFDATSPVPLPRGAMDAGRKADKTPLYVARNFFVIPETSEYGIGYYDPQNREAYFDLFGTHILQKMEILCAA